MVLAMSAIGAQFFFLRQLTVFNTRLGLLLLGCYLLLHVLALTGLSFLCLQLYDSFKKRLGQGKTGALRLAICIMIGVAFFLSFKVGIDYGLSIDIPFSWVLGKAGYDLLELTYLNGWTLGFIPILVTLFLLSDPRLSLRRGLDDRRHIYIRSKVLGAIRLFATRDNRLFGESPDNPITVKHKEVGEVAYSGGARMGYENPHFNDKIRLFPYGAAWLSLKALIGFAVAYRLAGSFALRFLMVQTYLTRTGQTFMFLLRRYYDLVFMRLTLNAVTPPSFPVEEAFTFEFIQFLYPYLLFFTLIWIVRLVIASFAEASVLVLTGRSWSASTRCVSNVFTALCLAVLLFIAKIPTMVFDKATPYYALTLITVFSTLLLLAVLTRLTAYIPTLRRWFSAFFGALIWGTTGLKLRAFILIAVLASSIVSPLIVSAVTVQPYMQGRQYEYRWVPAYLPTIEYTRWAYQVDNVRHVSSETITIPTSEVLRYVRIFTMEGAKLNMKPFVGVNWMSIDTADVDIVFVRGREYWIALLTLIRPPYGGDVDIWRANHVILTHSERILAIDARSTEVVDFNSLLDSTRTLEVYYGEGGLWEEVDEVYLNIGEFKEMHLPDYAGTGSYMGEPDYTYKDFWRLWKFLWMWRWDFAQGQYGDIKALVNRDAKNRVSKLLLPGIVIEPDGYPVIDENGDVYMLYWTWISWSPPSDYLDWPEHTVNKLVRRFAVVLVNVKNGEITGYLMNRESEDYILSFYRSWYQPWDEPVPAWLKTQLRYPEELLKQQIDVYNWYFQDDFNKWQSNQFYELTLGPQNQVFEDVRYIFTPIDGKLTWAAVRLVEWYKAPSRNLAGMYLAPSGEETEQLYFVDFGNLTVIGPWMALSTVNNNAQIRAQLTLHPNWVSGNILMYSIAGKLYYIIPYYAQQENLVLPAMVTVINAVDQTAGYYVIQNPRNPFEIEQATAYAFQNLGVGLPEEKDLEQRKRDLIRLFEDRGLTLAIPTALNPDVSYREGEAAYISVVQWNASVHLAETFIERWCVGVDKVLTWTDDTRINFGVLINVKGVVELHYITFPLK